MGQTAGFDQKNASGKKLNKQRSASKTFKNHVVGDALIMLGKVVRGLGFEVEEVERQVKGMFGPEWIPFAHHTTQEGDDIPYGAYKLTGWGLIIPSVGGDDARSPIPELTLTAVFEKGADEKLFDQLFTLLTLEAESHVSLFRHKAIRVLAPADFMIPHTIDVSSPPNLFLDYDVMQEIEISLLTPIRRASELKELGIKAQRGILLHGDYGTGKSLIAYLAAQESLLAKRTFVMCSMQMLSVAIHVSRFLQPSTLFIEDMDMMATSYTGLSTIRNMLSGVENKQGYDTITILTTNFLEKVIDTDRSLLRPERIDALIEVKSPSPGVVKQIITFSGQGWLKEEDDWDGLCQTMAAQKTTPAIIIEIMNRAKIEALTGDKIIPVGLVEKYFHTMKRQIALASPSPPRLDTNANRLEKSLHDAVMNSEEQDQFELP